MSQPRRILFVHDDDPAGPLSSFFAQDLRILKRWYEVEVLSLHPFSRGRLGIFMSPRVWRAVARADALFCWFGWSAPVVLMGSCLGKPSVIVAGGADVVHIPEIGYGVDPKKSLTFRLWLAGYRRAKKVLLFSESSRESFLALPGIDASKARTLYLGVEERFRPAGPKTLQVLTLCYISEASIRRKGLDTLVQAARMTPEIKYRIAGLVVDPAALGRLKSGAPPNVEFLGHLSDEAVLAELQAAKVYAQLSLHEGFGMAVAEAMACGCIPVVSGRGALPEVVGEAGIYVSAGDPAAAAQAFRQAVGAEDHALGEAARRRVRERFGLEQREAVVREVIEEVTSA